MEVYNMAKATKIKITEQPGGSFLIVIFFGTETIKFSYDDEAKAREAFTALSLFKGIAISDGDGILHINLIPNP